MQQEKDFIKREIQRLTLFLNKLIGSLQETDTEDVMNELEQVGAELKSEFGYDLNEIEHMDDQALIEKFKSLNENNIEQLAILLAIVEEKTANRYQNTNLIRKAIVLLEHVDSVSETFSIKRMELKIKLQQRL